jgi:hypothetical protein
MPGEERPITDERRPQPPSADKMDLILELGSLNKQLRPPPTQIAWGQGWATLGDIRQWE